MLSVTIDGINSTTKGICLAETPEIPVPERDVDNIEIRGRHGSLTKKYGYRDITFSLFFNLLERDGIKQVIRGLKPWLLNAKKISFSDDPGFYYRIAQVVIPNIENTLNLYGYFEVQIRAHPFQYKQRDLVKITNPGQVMYYGSIEGEPEISIFGSGDVSISINGRTFQIKGLSGSITIDSEAGLVYKGTQPAGNKMIGKWPYLDIGFNTISWTGPVTRLEIDPKEAYL